MRPCAQTWPRACLDSTLAPTTHAPSHTYNPLLTPRLPPLPLPSPPQDVICTVCGAVSMERLIHDGDWTRSFEGEESTSQVSGQAGRQRARVGARERGRGREGARGRANKRARCRDSLPPHLSPQMARFAAPRASPFPRPFRSAPSRTRSSPTARTCARVRARRPPARSQGTAAVRARLRPAARRRRLTSPPVRASPHPSPFPAHRLRHVARPQRRPHAPDPNHGRGCE